MRRLCLWLACGLTLSSCTMLYNEGKNSWSVQVRTEPLYPVELTGFPFSEQLITTLADQQQERCLLFTLPTYRQADSLRKALLATGRVAHITIKAGP